jgi:hypothetical protein
MIEPLRRQLQAIAVTAATLDSILREADPASLLPLDVVQANLELADLSDRLEFLAERLANAAAPRSERQDGR